jgi:glycine betaine/proline transport system permease protein
MSAPSLPLARPVARWLSRATVGVVFLAAVVALYLLFHGRWLLPHDDGSPAFGAFTDLRAWIDANRTTNPVLVFLVSVVRMSAGSLVEVTRTLLRDLTWPGVTVIAAMLGLVVGGRRIAILVGGGFLAMGVLGLWQESIDTLALTLASVALSLAIGIPIGVIAGRNDRFLKLLQPVLDVMQIMPTIAYLAPLTLFFLIGPATAAIATLIYAVPTTIRITALGIRGVAPTCVEAALSLGSTRWQTLRKVQLPLARSTIVLAINQTTCMALSMVVITALISAPGLGQSIVSALTRVDVGKAFDAGLAIVIMAVILDRLTTAASNRNEAGYRSGRVATAARRRRLVLVAAVASVAAVTIGLLTPFGAEFPKAVHFAFAGPVNEASDWIKLNLYALTNGFKNAITYGLINPLQSLLTSAPWWLVVLATAGLAMLVGGVRAAVTAGLCLIFIALLGVWEHGMITLATTLVAAALTLGVGLALGVASARSDRFAAAQRPFLDAAQTMPAFVYLLPALALFGATRFTAIVAALIYAAPSVIRLVEDGIRGVPATVIEAATSSGATPRQLLWKVQLPMARASLLLAANQGIVLVLAMVVVGGLVGAGALGFDVVLGFSKRSSFGLGMAAAIAIVLLGIMLDRITQGAASRRTEEGGPGR